MSALTDTRCYVQKPCDQFWNVSKGNYIIEAGPVDITEKGLAEWQKTDKFVRDYLKVINPTDFKWRFVKRNLWIECSGPARKLAVEEYITLYHYLDPGHSLPEKWNRYPCPKELKVHKSNV